MRGLKRLNKHCPKQALAMTPAVLSDMFNVINHDDPLQVTFWAAALVSFFLLLRKSNLVPDTLSSFDAAKQLCRQDFQWFQDRVIVTLRWSKTNQFGEHQKYSLPKIPGSNICPYSALQNMWRLLPDDSGIAFRRPDQKPLIYSQFQSLLRVFLTSIEEPAELYSSHSFRRGGTTFAFLCGVPSELIKTLGGWSSECYLKYLQFPLEARTAATELMKFRIQAMNW